MTTRLLEARVVLVGGQREAHRADLGAQGLRQPDVRAGQDDGAGATGEPLRRLAQQVGHVRLLELRPEAVEHVEGRHVGADDVVERGLRVLGAVDAVGRALAAKPGGAPPDEHRQLQLPRGALHEGLRAVLLGGLDEQRAVAGADEELEVVKGIVVHRRYSAASGTSSMASELQPVAQRPQPRQRAASNAGRPPVLHTIASNGQRRPQRPQVLQRSMSMRAT